MVALAALIVVANDPAPSKSVIKSVFVGVRAAGDRLRQFPDTHLDYMPPFGKNSFFANNTSAFIGAPKAGECWQLTDYH